MLTILWLLLEGAELKRPYGRRPLWWYHRQEVPRLRGNARAGWIPEFLFCSLLRSALLMNRSSFHTGFKTVLVTYGLRHSAAKPSWRNLVTSWALLGLTPSVNPLQGCSHFISSRVTPQLCWYLNRANKPAVIIQSLESASSASSRSSAWSRQDWRNRSACV